MTALVPVTALQHNLRWVGPAPLWPKGGASTSQMRQPALLRFTSDQFVNELTQAIANGTLARHVAAWESARLPPPGTPPPWTPSQGDLPLKLFQPIHGRFYIVAASFVCQQLGLPDHALKVASQERTYFVLRRIASDGSGQEMAWVPDPNAPNDPGKHVWRSLTNPATVDPSEELLPLFPVFVPPTATTPGRRLHAGLIPTSSRETLASAAITTAPPASSDTDPRVFEANARIRDPYVAIIKATAQVANNYSPPGTAAATTANDPTIAPMAQASALLMLDLAEILEKYVPDVYKAITKQPGASAPTSGASGALYTTLHESVADTRHGVTWEEAIYAAWQAAAAMDKAGTSLPTMSATFNLFYANESLVGSGSDPTNPASYVPLDPTISASPLLEPATLGKQLENAIVANSAPFNPPDQVVGTAVVPKLDGAARYVVRCVFQRCALKRAQFGALFPPIVSDPTQAFEIAPFFDTDAPARTIRIPMPSDTSPSALRKFPKSVGFLLSPQLQKQLCQVSDLSSILKGQLGGPCLNVGEICCFSIPIITIIAMILMMMIAILLNFVFWWLPFLKICFPVPTVAALSPATEPEEA